jgi:adenylate cyclase
LEREKIMTTAPTVQKPAKLAPWRDAAGIGHIVRARLRLTSALILLSFVVCHLVSHIFLLVSIPLASRALGFLMAFWWTETGAIVLASALVVHFCNALWSIYVRRSMRLARWELVQIVLGLAIIPLMVRHVVATRIASEFLLASNDYNSVLLSHWVLNPGYPLFHIAAVLTVWVHASIGIHFWLHTRKWYPDWRGAFAIVGLLIPTLAIAGYIAAGNHVLRQAEQPQFIENTLKNARSTPEKVAAARRIERRITGAYFGLLLLPVRRARRAPSRLSDAPAAHAHPFQRPACAY